MGNYDTRKANERQHMKRAQASFLHPYILYRVGNSEYCQKEHIALDGLILHKNDSWWNDHLPPNGNDCNCWTQALTEERKAILEKTGLTHPPTIDGRPGYNTPVKTTPPESE